MQSYFLLSSSKRLPEGASLEGDSLKTCDIVSTIPWNEVGFETIESAGARYSLHGSTIKDVALLGLVSQEPRFY